MTTVVRDPFEAKPKARANPVPPLKRVPGIGKNVVYDDYLGRWVLFRAVS